eukprot:gene2566-5010_t
MFSGILWFSLSSHSIRYTLTKTSFRTPMRCLCAKDNVISVDCKDVEELEHLGSSFGMLAEKGDVYLLKGDLGAGKTCLTRGFIRSILQDNELVVTSPSYLLDNTYVDDFDNTIHHMDLYRLPTGCDLSMMGIPDIFTSCICVIEWPQRMDEKQMPSNYLDITISINKNQTRSVALRPVGSRWTDNDRMQRGGLWWLFKSKQ